MDRQQRVKETSSVPIAEGRTAEIYRWDDQHILKLYRDWCPPDWVEYEARIARAVYAAGILSPEPGEILEVNGRRGLVYEFLEGISMLQDLSARPWTLLEHARTLAQLHIGIHRTSASGLPSYHDRLRYDLQDTTYLPLSLRDKVLERLEALPQGNQVCHGDFHPANVLITTRGPVVIDWMTACAGSPWADVARTSLVLSIGAKAAGRQLNLILRTAVLLYQRIYLNRYRTLQPDRENELDRWMPLLAAARLSEDIVAEREALVRIVKEAFSE